VGFFRRLGKKVVFWFLSVFDPPGTPPPKMTNPRRPTPPSLYIYIYREREKERERHGLGDFWGWVNLWVFWGFPEAWALPVASCLCRAYTMPTHYNTLQKVSWTLTPGRVFKETTSNIISITTTNTNNKYYQTRQD